MKKSLMFVVFLGTSVASFSQFNAILYSLTPISHNCDLTCEPLDDGINANIYWDRNANGPDAGDIQPLVGDGFAQCNFNRFRLNGAEILGVPGTFYTDPAFTISTTTPLPSRYYIVIEVENIRWTSGVFTIPNGLSDIAVDGWVCDFVSVPPIQIDSIHLDPRGIELVDTCLVFFWYGEPLYICYSPVGPEFSPPPVSVIPGCALSVWGCSSCAGPGSYWFDPNAWNYDPATASLCNSIIASDFRFAGCVRYIEDSHIPVQFGSFTAEPRHEAILLAWSTLSEHNILSFNLKRDGMVVHSAGATNTSTGSMYTHLDSGLDDGRLYEYSIDIVNLDGTLETWPSTVTATPSSNPAIITEYALHQNYPNPFNPSTNLVFDVVAENNVNLTVYNAMGQEVGTLVNGTVAAGRHTVSFDASNLTSGLYFYTVKIGNEFTATKKMLLVK